MVTFISHSPADTAALGEQWGRAARPGWVVGLSGELGAGKTQLVKGLARGLGIEEVVRSPSFALVHEYVGGRLPLWHLDFYRLEGRAAIAAAGLEEYLEAPRGVTVVEWIERWLDEKGAGDKGRGAGSRSLVLEPEGWATRYRQVTFETLGDNDRRITYEDFGA